MLHKTLLALVLASLEVASHLKWICFRSISLSSITITSAIAIEGYKQIALVKPQDLPRNIPLTDLSDPKCTLCLTYLH